MLTFISKASTLLRIVVCVQLGIAVAIAYAFTVSTSVSLLGLVILILLFFFGLRFLIVLMQFGISWIYGSTTPANRTLSISAAIGMFLRESTASLSAFVWRMPFLPHIQLPQPSPDKTLALGVLLVHGYGCNRAMWLKFSNGLTAQGYATEAINLEPPLGSIDDYPALIEFGVAKLLSNKSIQQVAIVAHSMGGLAARAYLNASTEQQNQRIYKAITLGTPHQGTVHAALGQGQNTRQMKRKSTWRETLVSRERATDVGKLVCILTHHDNIVAPQALQTVAGAKTIELHGIGHVALAYSEEVLQLVLTELQDHSRSI
jgi:triacylglycerol lipase